MVDSSDGFGTGQRRGWHLDGMRLLIVDDEQAGRTGARVEARGQGWLGDIVAVRLGADTLMPGPL